MLEVIRGVSIAFVIKILGAGLAFTLNILISRLLGANGAGIYFLSLSVVTLSSVVARFGLDGALLRFISVKVSNDDWGGAREIYWNGIRIALLGGLITTLVVFFGAPVIAEKLFSKKELVDPLKWMSLTILPFTILTLEAESLKGLRNIKDAMIIQGVGIPLVMLMLIFPMAYLYEVNGVSIAYLVSTVSVATLGAWYWKRSLDGHATKPLNDSSKQDLIKSCISLFFVSIIGRGILPNAPPLLLGIWSVSDEVGIFSAAQRLAMLVGFLLSTVNSVVTPKFAELFSKHNLLALEKTARHTTMLITILATPIFIALVFGANWFMRIFGEEFVAGSRVLSILAIGQFVNIICGSVGQLLIISGKEKYLRNATVISAVSQVVLGIILIPSYGMIGAAIASALSLAGLGLGATLIVKKEVGIKIFI